MVPGEAELLAYIKRLEDENQRLNLVNWNLRNELRDCHFIQEKFSKAFHHNQAVMCITRLADGVVLDVNQRFEEILGYSRDELLGRNVLELELWLEKEQRRELLTELLKHGFVRNYESTGRRKSGAIVNWLCSVSVFEMHAEKYLLASLVDITQRKLTEQELQSSREKFFKVFNENQALMAIVAIDDGRFMDINKTALETFGYTRAEIVGNTFLQKGLWVDTEERDRIRGQLSNSGHADSIECTLRHKSGDSVTLMCSVNLMTVDGVNCVIVSGADITAHKKAGEALQQSQQLLALIINSIPLAIIIRTIKEKAIVAVNDIFLTRHGFNREEVIGKTIAGLGFVKDHAKMEEFFATVREYGLVRNMEIDIVSPRGKAFTTLLSGVYIVWQGIECFLTISNDITEVREYQQELVRLDNLNLMGQMAASIAHEVRNPMTSIKGFLQLFETETKYSDDKEALELMIEELDRVNSIITSFLSLAQKNVIHIKLHNLNDSIRNLQPLIMADALKNDVTLRTELGDVPRVMVDEGEIRQILLNLTQNAMQAMPKGGRLTLKTFTNADAVKLVVKDSGPGIPSEVIDKIGTPFITTKKDGTGLGLAVCYSIAERLNATISIDTSPDGTGFTVSFPLGH